MQSLSKASEWGTGGVCSRRGLCMLTAQGTALITRWRQPAEAAAGACQPSRSRLQRTDGQPTDGRTDEPHFCTMSRHLRQHLHDQLLTTWHSARPPLVPLVLEPLPLRLGSGARWRGSVSATNEPRISCSASVLLTPSNHAPPRICWLQSAKGHSASPSLRGTISGDGLGRRWGRNGRFWVAVCTTTRTAYWAEVG